MRNRVIADVAGDREEQISSRVNPEGRGAGIKVKVEGLSHRAQDEEQFAFDGKRNQQSYLPQDAQEGY